MDQLLRATVRETEVLARQANSPGVKPVLVKIAPDLTRGQIDDVVEVCLARQVRGIIATNTTLSRADLRQQTTEAGGLSGRPLATRSLEIVDYLSQRLDHRIPIIGVGGIFGPDDARRMFDAGASLLQIYTGFIYEGPWMIKRINKSIAG